MTRLYDCFPLGRRMPAAPSDPPRAGAPRGAARLWLLALLAVVPALVSCEVDRVSDVAVPSGLGVSLVIVGEPSSALIDPFEEADNLFVRAELPNDQTVEKTFELSGEDVIRSTIELPIEGDEATVLLTVQIRRGSNILLQTSESVVVTRGADNQVELDFVIPGATVAVGLAHACALTASGEAFCWGANERGQLGTGDEASSGTPRPVAGGLRFREVAAGRFTTCALSREGEAFCWGSGPLGREGVSQSSIPVAVSGGHVFDQIVVAGASYACGLDRERQAFCWGTGPLGGDISPSPVPVPVRQSGVQFASISAGLVHTCALTPAGAAFCWGSGSFRALGTGETTGASHPTPVPVVGGHTFSQIQAGATTTCGVADGQSALCWGSDFFGSLGTGSTARVQPRPSPAAIAGSPAFVTVGAGGENNIFSVNCGITADGSAFCWGPNAYGALGSTTASETCGPLNQAGDPFTCSGTPQRVQGGHDFIGIFPSGGFACALTSDREVLCWGQNSSGQLGAQTSETCNVGGEEEACSFAPVRVGLP